MKTKDLETLRKTVKNSILIYTVSIIIFFGFILMFLIFKTFNLKFIDIKAFLIIVLFLLGMIILFVLHSQKLKEAYVKAFKKNIVLKQLNKYFNNINYLPESQLESDYLKELNCVFEFGNNTHITDYLCATFNNENFKLFNLYSFSDHNTSSILYESSFESYTIFSSYWLLFNLNFQMCNQSILLEKKSNIIFDNISTNFTKIECPFNKKLNLYILKNNKDQDLDFSNNFKDLVNMLNNMQNVSYIFINKNKIYIGAINKRGLFEIDVHDEHNDINVENDIKKIICIVDLIEKFYNNE